MIEPPTERDGEMRSSDQEASSESSSVVSIDEELAFLTGLADDEEDGIGDSTSIDTAGAEGGGSSNGNASGAGDEDVPTDIREPEEERQQQQHSSPSSLASNLPPDIESEGEGDDDDFDGDNAMEEDEEEEDNEDVNEDVYVEEHASDDFEGTTPANRIDLIAKVDELIDEARIRARVEGNNQEFAHKLDMEKIREAQEAVLADVGGPNESLECKLQQLKMHERIHQLYVGGLLTQKTLMSHYLHATADCRQRWIKQIEAILEHHGLDENEIKVIYIPVRLGKIAPGYYILVDRGFPSCAPSYPFLNGQITPFFLDGRDQFTEGEISADRTKCKLRYGSETKFSQVTDYTALKDRIARSFFRHLHEICDFAHGMSNFCEPFYLPHDEDDDYFATVRKDREQKRRDIAQRLQQRKRSRERGELEVVEEEQEEDNEA